jgi:hypothetical protein
MFGIQGDTAALNDKASMFYFYNLTLTGANLITVDVVNKKIVSDVPLDKEGADNVQYIWYNYPQNPKLLGINGWKVIGFCTLFLSFRALTSSTPILARVLRLVPSTTFLTKPEW